MSSSVDYGSSSPPNEQSSTISHEFEPQSSMSSQTVADNAEYEFAVEMLDTDSQDDTYEPDG